MGVGQVPFNSEILFQKDFGECSTRSTRLLSLLCRIALGPLVVDGSVGVLPNK